MCQNLDILRRHRAKYILVLAGDHVYKMDYASLIDEHVAQGRQCSVDDALDAEWVQRVTGKPGRALQLEPNRP